MRRFMRWLPAALVFVALALAMFQPNASRTVRAADLQEKCNNCMAWVQQRFEQCTEVHGEDHIPCYDQFNEGVVICHRNFCEQ